jgi:replication factor A1
MVTVEQAKNMRSKIDVEGTIQKCGETRTVNLKSGGQIPVMRAELVDHTGAIEVVFWDTDIAKVRNGSKVALSNAYTNTFKGKTSLTKGKFGTLTVKEY